MKKLVNYIKQLQTEIAKDIEEVEESGDMYGDEWNILDAQLEIVNLILLQYREIKPLTYSEEVEKAIEWNKQRQNLRGTAWE